MNCIVGNMDKCNDCMECHKGEGDASADDDLSFLSKKFISKKKATLKKKLTFKKKLSWKM